MNNTTLDILKHSETKRLVKKLHREIYLKRQQYKTVQATQITSAIRDCSSYTNYVNNNMIVQATHITSAIT